MPAAAPLSFAAWTADLLRQVAEELDVFLPPQTRTEPIDAIWDWIEALFRAGDFALVDKALAAVDADAGHVDQLFAWAVAASAARSRLPAYAPFLDRLAARLRRDGEDPDDLLQGLRP